ncbi:MAG: hypothetical protein IPJ07_17915 [Acidobacteria bacterium]|nr:hypothetical protein [Acidobacteriota bacterium]
MDYDPIPMLEKVRVPVLAVWGENDVLVPVSESRVAIESAFARGGNRSVNCRAPVNWSLGGKKYRKK